MSWSLDLTTDRPVTMDDAGAIVAELPADLRTNRPMQSWGWSMATDISLPDGLTWNISGAGFSREHSTSMARALAAGLRERGYHVETGKRRD